MQDRFNLSVKSFAPYNDDPLTTGMDSSESLLINVKIADSNEFLPQPIGPRNMTACSDLIQGRVEWIPLCIAPKNIVFFLFSLAHKSFQLHKK